MDKIESIVLVHVEQSGDTSYHVIGGPEVRLFLVDDRCPNDRVYEITSRADPKIFREIIPEGSDIGHSGDDRHEAIAHKIEAAMQGQRHLSAVPPTKDSNHE